MADKQQDDSYRRLNPREVQRRDFEHSWHMAYLKEQNKGIIFAPVDKTKKLRVIDIGCIDGVVIRDLQTELPNASFVGTENDMSFVPKDPGSVRYEKVDTRKSYPAHLHSAFDLVHVRHVMAFIVPDVTLSTLISHMVETMAPGAWLQIMEPLAEEDLPRQGPAMKDFHIIIKTMLENMGMGNLQAQFRSAFEKAGLKDIKIEILEGKAGRSFKDNQDVYVSMAGITAGLELSLEFLKALNIDLPEVTKDIVNRWQEEMLKPGGGGSFYNLIVTGRKP